MNRRDLLEQMKLLKVKELATELFESWKRQERDKPALDLWAVFRGERDGLTGELLQENARQVGQPYDKFKPYIEFRDLTKGTAAAGGNLVQTDVQELADLLRPFSVTAQMGIQIEDGLVGDQLIPKLTVKHAVTWLQTEASTGTLSTPTLQALSLTPKNVIINGQMSRQIYKQANMPGFLEQELTRSLATAIDQAVLAGSAGSFQPVGLINVAGIQTMSGTSLSGASVNHMKMLGASANAMDGLCSYLATPSVRLLLENREKITNTGLFVWADDRMSSRPAFASTDLPAGMLIYGPWPTIYVGVWGKGFTLELNPYESTNFKKAIIEYRMMLSMDVGIRQAGGFVIASPNVT